MIAGFIIVNVVLLLVLFVIGCVAAARPSYPYAEIVGGTVYALPALGLSVFGWAVFIGVHFLAKVW